MTHIRVDRHESVAVITIDRRDRFNSLDVNTARDLRKAGLQCARDERVRVVVLRGEGGVFCSGADLKYIRAGGDARDLVLGLEVVLPDGRVWNGLKALRKDNTGYDLKHLFLGAEGTLGIITTAVLKLFAKPSATAGWWSRWVGVSRWCC